MLPSYSASTQKLASTPAFLHAASARWISKSKNSPRVQAPTSVLSFKRRSTETLRKLKRVLQFQKSLQAHIVILENDRTAKAIIARNVGEIFRAWQVIAVNVYLSSAGQAFPLLQCTWDFGALKLFVSTGCALHKYSSMPLEMPNVEAQRAAKPSAAVKGWASFIE